MLWYILGIISLDDDFEDIPRQLESFEREVKKLLSISKADLENQGDWHIA